MMDTSRSILYRLVSHNPFIDQCMMYASRQTEWYAIPNDEQETLIGIATECMHVNEIVDLFINSDRLGDAVVCLAHYMKHRNGKGDLNQAMSQCMVDALEKTVEEAYTYLLADWLTEDMQEHGKYPYTNRETGELEWRHA